MSNSILPNEISYGFNKKLFWSSVAAAVFIAVSLPQVYYYTDKLTGSQLNQFNTITDSCPTPEGKFLHAIVFFALNYFIMKLAQKYKATGAQLTDGLMAKYAFYSALIFFLLSSTDSYKLTGKLFGGLSNDAGCPNVKGVLVHGVVYLVVLLLVMYFPKDN